MRAGTARRTEPRKAPASCDVVALSGLLSSERMEPLKGIRTEACGRVIRLHGRMDPAARRLAERLDEDRAERSNQEEEEGEP